MSMTIGAVDEKKIKEVNSLRKAVKEAGCEICTCVREDDDSVLSFHQNRYSYLLKISGPDSGEFLLRLKRSDLPYADKRLRDAKAKAVKQAAVNSMA